MPFGREGGRWAGRWDLKGGDGKERKKRISDRGVERHHPTIENLIRITHFARVGEEIAREEAGMPIWVREEKSGGVGGKTVFGMRGEGERNVMMEEMVEEVHYVEETVLEMGSGNSTRVVIEN